MRIVHSIIALVLLSSFVLVRGQQDSPQASQATPAPSVFTIYPGLVVEVKEYCDAYLRKDNARLIELTYPKMIEKVGKENLMIEATRGEDQMQADGLQVLSWTPAEAIQLVRHSGSLYSVVPTKVRMKQREVTWAWDLSLIAISNDQGQNWTFVSADCVNVCEMFPQVANELIALLAKVSGKGDQP